MKKDLKILLLDDHSLFLNGIKAIIEKTYESAVFYCYSSIQELTNSITNYNSYDILITDMELPGENTFSFLKSVKHVSNTPILVVSMHEKIGTIKQCEKIGVNGYILKNDDEFLVPAIEKLISGNTFYSPKIQRKMNSSEAQNLLISPRQKELIKLISEGFSNIEISEKLNISVETVKTHKKNIKAKLGLETTHDIIDFGRNNFII